MARFYRSTLGNLGLGMVYQLYIGLLEISHFKLICTYMYPPHVE